MSTNLLFAYPDIPFGYNTTHTLTDKAADTGYDLAAVVNGTRAQRFQFDTTNDQPKHRFVISSGRTAEYIIVSQAHLLIKGGSDIVTLVSNVATVHSDSWVIGDLVGPNSEDYIATFSESASATTWTVTFNSTNNTAQFPHGQIYFGKFFDFGRDPEFGSNYQPIFGGQSVKRVAMAYNLQYRGVTNAKREDFEEKIGRFKASNPVFLYTRDHDPVLLNKKLVHCVIDSYEFQARGAAVNDLTINLREIY